MILEAIQGEGGVVTAPAKWLQKIREVTERHNIVFDFGRSSSGALHVQAKCLLFEHAGIEPDVVVMSKAVGGSLPIGCFGY